MQEYRLPEYKLCAGLDSLQLQNAEVPDPDVGEVRIRVHAVSLNYRDIMTAGGKHKLGVKDNVRPCSDAAGVIEKIGPAVKTWLVGDRVMPSFTPDWVDGRLTASQKLSSFGGPVDGVLAEYICVPAYCLVRIPPHLSFEEACCLPCAALSAWNALFGQVPVLKGGESVVLQGTGGVSIFALQIANAAGAKTIVTSSSDEKLAIASRLGAKHLINYKQKPDWDKEVMKLTDGEGADRIVEVGGAGTLQKSCTCVAYQGNISTIGFVAGSSSSEFELASAILSKAIVVRGILCGSVAQFRELCKFLEVTGIKPIIDKVFPFTEAKDAFRHLESQSHVGKVVIKVLDD